MTDKVTFTVDEHTLEMIRRMRQTFGIPNPENDLTYAKSITSQNTAFTDAMRYETALLRQNTRKLKKLLIRPVT